MPESEAQDQSIVLDAPLDDFLDSLNLEDILDLLSDRTISRILGTLKARIRIKEDRDISGKLAYVEAGSRLKIIITPKLIGHDVEPEFTKYDIEYHTKILIDDFLALESLYKNDARASLIGALRELSTQMKRARQLLNLVGDLSNVVSDVPVVLVAKDVDEVERLVDMADSIIREERAP